MLVTMVERDAARFEGPGGCSVRCSIRTEEVIDPQLVDRVLPESRISSLDCSRPRSKRCECKINICVGCVLVIVCQRQNTTLRWGT